MSEREQEQAIRDWEITELTAEWYRLLNANGFPHKDRDCHFVIQQRWSYGQPPIWSVEHEGYVNKDVSIEVESLEAAQSVLVTLLRRFIREEQVLAYRRILLRHRLHLARRRRGRPGGHRRSLAARYRGV